MSTFLVHYASPYYDPVKAHEYYEEHKKLKGRNSHPGRTLNETGNAAKLYVKKTIDEKRDKDIETTQKEIEDERDKYISSYASEVQNEIGSLYNELRSMSESEKKRRGYQIKRKIDKLRKKNAETRKTYINACRIAIKEMKQQLNEKYANEYNSELDRIYNDSETSSGKASAKSSRSGINYGVKEQYERKQARKQNSN